MFLAPLPKPHHFLFSLPTSAFLSLSLCVFVLLSCALFCEVFTGIIQPDSLQLCCFNTFLHYLRFSNLFASSPKPPNDLICPTFCSTIQLLQLSHASQLSPAISYPSPPAPKTPPNSFSHNNIFTFAIFTYFLHLSTAEPSSFKNPSSCFLNFVICLSFAFSLTSLIFSGLTSSSLQKPWRISFSTHFWFFSFPIISTHQPSIASLPLVF